MAKTSKPKNRQRGPNSRAARRAESPTLNGNIDKSLLSIPRPASPDSSGRILASQFSGVTKRSSRKSQLTRHQRLRRERGVNRADNVRRQLEVRHSKSGEKDRRVKSRKKGWEEVNEDLSKNLIDVRPNVANHRFGVLAKEDDMESKDAVIQVDQSDGPLLIQSANAPEAKDTGLEDTATAQSKEPDDEIL